MDATRALPTLFAATSISVVLGACSGSQTGSGGWGGAGATTTAVNGTSSTSSAPNATSSTAASPATSTTGASSTSTGTGMGDYCTNFDATENPISEGGVWAQQGGLSGLDWTNVRTANGLAFGTLTGNDGYDDSIALLSGFGPDQRVSAVVHMSGQRSQSTSTHEVELILRGSYAPHEQHVYECNLGYSGPSGWYAQIIVLNGPIGTFQDITQGVGSLGDIADGDVFTAEIVGNTIQTSVNGVVVATATDSSIATGQPGMGFFWRATENVDDFAFTSFCATKL